MPSKAVASSVQTPSVHDAAVLRQDKVGILFCEVAFGAALDVHVLKARCRAELWCHLLSNKADTSVVVIHSAVEAARLRLRRHAAVMPGVSSMLRG